MSNLLSAYFSRLWREKIFWIALAFMFVFGAFDATNRYSFAAYLEPGATFALDDYCFSFHWVIGIVSAVVSSLFLGREYQDGTLRNKLIAGHSRGAIYLSGWLVNTASTLLLCLGCFLAACLFGIPAFGGFQGEPNTILLLAFASLLSAAVYAALFTMIQMLTRSRAAAVTLCILIALAIMIGASQLQSWLNEPAVWEGYSYLTETGELVVVEDFPNSTYLSGAARTVVETIYEFLPWGQGSLLVNGGGEHLGCLPFYSGILIAAFTVIGVLGFQKKEIS